MNSEKSRQKNIDTISKMRTNTAPKGLLATAPTLKCMQDDDDGKFYCYRKQQGNWVMTNSIPYDSIEECQAAISS